ncbi:hypothetical protein J6590_028673 [Homalodisca vitripennis]|nr:hypothetical protein J6590_028673 [Homalodisca vitripennis]
MPTSATACNVLFANPKGSEVFFPVPGTGQPPAPWAVDRRQDFIRPPSCCRVGSVWL